MKILTTVGTSLIDNYLKAHNDAKNSMSDLPFSDKLLKNNELSDRQIKQCLNTLSSFFMGYQKHNTTLGKSEWTQEGSSPNQDASAEIKSIIKIANGWPVEVHLLHTDTEASRLASLGIKKFFEEVDDYKSLITVKEPERIEKLKVHNPEEFREGAVNLLDKINELQDQYTVLNISGGYKAIIPIATIIGQLNNLPTKYIYEDSDEVIDIPRISLQFDFSPFEDHYELIKALHKNDQDTLQYYKEDEKSYSTLRQEGLIDTDNTLTTISRIILQHYQNFMQEGSHSRKSPYGELMELKTFKYYVETCPSAKIIHSEKDHFEYDVFVEKNDGGKIAVEVKPGGNIPIWKEKDGNKSLEYRIKEGAFRTLFQNNTDNVCFHIVLYRSVPIHSRAKEQLYKLLEEYSDIKGKIKLFWLKTPDNPEDSAEIEPIDLEKCQ